ncbi:MAG: hypothetical protein JNL90_03435 [Planctomycetes bacterium]|nr:hypothetical protein [Planctomycetota bacterium]
MVAQALVGEAGRVDERPADSSPAATERTFAAEPTPVGSAGRVPVPSASRGAWRARYRSGGCTRPIALRRDRFKGNSMRLLLAFIAGLACAVLLGAAAPRGTTIKWQYRLLDMDVEEGKVRQMAEAIAKATRKEFDSDAAAAAAAVTAARAKWYGEMFREGWMPIAAVAIDTDGDLHSGFGNGMSAVLARPAGLRVAPAKSAYSHDRVVAAIAERDKSELAKAVREGRGIITHSGRREGAFDWGERDERRTFIRATILEELERAGAAGALCVESPFADPRNVVQLLGVQLAD